MDTYTLGPVYTWIPTNGLVIHKVKIFTVCYPMRLPAGFKSVLNYELTLDRCRGVGDCIHTPRQRKKRISVIIYMCAHNTIQL